MTNVDDYFVRGLGEWSGGVVDIEGGVIYFICPVLATSFEHSSIYHIIDANVRLVQQIYDYSMNIIYMYTKSLTL